VLVQAFFHLRVFPAIAVAQEAAAVAHTELVMLQLLVAQELAIKVIAVVVVIQQIRAILIP
jgi:hypothetical protein